MKKLSILLTLLTLSSCGIETNKAKRVKLELEDTGVQSILIQGAQLDDTFIEEARQLNIQVEGHSILKLTGQSQDLTLLEIPVGEAFSYIQDAAIDVVKDNAGTPDFTNLYLAKKEFGIEKLAQTHPHADGRGVIIG